MGKLSTRVMLLLLLCVVACAGSASRVEELVRLWAPLVWLAPGEQYFPSAVQDFLPHVSARALPEGKYSQSWYLFTNMEIDVLVKNASSFLHGRSPTQHPVPVYALLTLCPEDSEFHVTYWMFYPYSQGKAMCMLSLGPLGPWPIPLFRGRCLGTTKVFGSHVGDWEHMSLIFRGRSTPEVMYVSAHDAGAYYRFDTKTFKFKFERQELRKGVLQRPIFPATVQLMHPDGQHPILFAAKGSHGLWAAPGRHRFVRVPRLYDEGGYGVPWATWQKLEILSKGNTPSWMYFLGRWGNPRSKCHPLARRVCQYSDGPTGIPLKKSPFRCSNG